MLRVFGTGLGLALWFLSLEAVNSSAAPAKNESPRAKPDAYTVAEDSVLNVKHALLRPVKVKADVNDDKAHFTLDGEAWTYWNAAAENPALTFDLGEVRRILGFQETTGGFPGNPFTFSISKDNLTYSKVAQGALTEKGFGDHPINPAQARFLRLNVRRTDALGFGELAEFRALIHAGVLANDSDPDGDELTAELVRGPSDGKLRLLADGSFTYEPRPNFNGIDRFTYKPHDGKVAGEPVEVVLTVTPVNDPPTAIDDVVVCDGVNAVTIKVLDNDKDVDGDKLVIATATQGNVGAVALDLERKMLTYTPTKNFNDGDRFTYTIVDPHGATATATVVIKPKGK